MVSLFYHFWVYFCMSPFSCIITCVFYMHYSLSLVAVICGVRCYWNVLNDCGVDVDKLYTPENIVVLWLLYPYRIITLGPPHCAVFPKCSIPETRNQGLRPCFGYKYKVQPYHSSVIHWRSDWHSLCNVGCCLHGWLPEQSSPHTFIIRAWDVSMCVFNYSQ